MVAWSPIPYIFVHIPKSAGSSIHAILIPNSTTVDCLEKMSIKERERHWLYMQGHPRVHAKFRQYQSALHIKKFYVFTIVRNPWDRAVSQIEFLLKHNPDCRKWLFTGKTFKENLHIYCNTKESVAGHDLGSDQTGYLIDTNGKLTLDYVGRFEHLSEDVSKIMVQIGIENAPALPHILNGKRVQHYSSYYDEESMQWVATKFRRDIENFGYKFGKPPKARDVSS